MVSQFPLPRWIPSLTFHHPGSLLRNSSSPRQSSLQSHYHTLPHLAKPCPLGHGYGFLLAKLVSPVKTKFPEPPCHPCPTSTELNSGHVASAQWNLVHRAISDCPKHMNLCLFLLDIPFGFLVMCINARSTLALLLTKPTKWILIGRAVGSGFSSRFLRQYPYGGFIHTHCRKRPTTPCHHPHSSLVL